MAEEGEGGLTCLELCAGAGGMAIGMKEAGFRHVRMYERDARYVQTLPANGWEGVSSEDVTEVDFSSFRGNVDVVCGGPPCQAFSRGGKLGGEADPRNLWDTAVRCVLEVRPRAFLFENAAGFLSPRFEGYRSGLVGTLEREGYSVQALPSNACEHGVPQRRARSFLVGVRSSSSPFSPPEPSLPSPTLRDALSSLGPPDGRNAHVERRAIVGAYKGHTPSCLDAPCKTIVAGSGGPGGGNNSVQLDDGSRRYLTLREMATVQTFPTTYQFHPTWTHAVHQIGNACPPSLAKAWGGALSRCLSS